jgi:hypothetical protein
MTADRLGSGTRRALIEGIKLEIRECRIGNSFDLIELPTQFGALIRRPENFAAYCPGRARRSLEKNMSPTPWSTTIITTNVSPCYAFSTSGKPCVRRRDGALSASWPVQVCRSPDYWEMEPEHQNSTICHHGIYPRPSRPPTSHGMVSSFHRFCPAVSHGECPLPDRRVLVSACQCISQSKADNPCPFASLQISSQMKSLRPSCISSAFRAWSEPGIILQSTQQLHLDA